MKKHPRILAKKVRKGNAPKWPDGTGIRDEMAKRQTDPRPPPRKTARNEQKDMAARK